MRPGPCCLLAHAKVEGEIAEIEQQPANVEAHEQATEILRELQAQSTDLWYHGRESKDVSMNDEGAEVSEHTANDECAAATDDCAAPTAATLPCTTSLPEQMDVEKVITEFTNSDTAAELPLASDNKPMVDPPEYEDGPDARVRDTDETPYWIPGAFPTIFQNETGDPYNYVWRKPEMKSWGPHIMRSRGWHAQAHTTFCYWWLNMVQRTEALSAKKWYLRDHPNATGYTLDTLRNMSVKALAKNMVGYTAKIPGTQASKSQLRRIIFAMVRQIEIETASMEGGQERIKTPGDVPSLFGTLTTQRYHWEQIQQIIAQVEGKDYKELSKSKRRELVNKYPLFVSWYCAVRLELILKTVVVPLYGASAYIAVFEWSPTGGMVHLLYILWKRGAPRFDLQANSLLETAKALRKTVWL